MGNLMKHAGRMRLIARYIIIDKSDSIHQVNLSAYFIIMRIYIIRAILLIWAIIS
ncbi:hypothetical protein SAMN05421579_10143 [Xenorhabdus japonica]|uniref:Uncharacterized protein n=1 Tax=Xenorhabdus japonica TaxID=53341 RepID=A0A1I4Y783_9GAMM|nr:hypothetical protein SAMN05421579_10143 [Xenorhabdus japonica]